MEENSFFPILAGCVLILALHTLSSWIVKWRQKRVPSPLGEESAHGFFRGWYAWAVWASYPCMIIGTMLFAGVGGWFFTQGVVWRGRDLSWRNILLAGVVWWIGTRLSSYGRRFYRLDRQARALSADALLAR